MDGFIVSPSNSSSAAFSSSEDKPARFTFVADKSPATGTLSLLPKVKMLLDVSQAQGVTKVAYLADASVAFFQGDKSDWGWGCGYRNIQMMLSYVVQQPCPKAESSPSRSSLGNIDDVPLIPTITQIQQQLEFAWSMGFDNVGAMQLGHKVEGTKKWIGTTEAWSVLCSLGIRCKILDFHTPTGPGGTHPALLTAVYNYFCEPPWSPLSAPSSIELPPVEPPTHGSKIVQTSKPPLYMQHQGHSKTIVGIEILESGAVNLLVFDPGRWLHKAIPEIEDSSLSRSKESLDGSMAKVEGGRWNAQYLLKAFRFQMHRGNSKSQYQLLGISGLYHEPQDEVQEKSRKRIELQLLTTHTSQSIGWDEEERQSSKEVTTNTRLGTPPSTPPVTRALHAKKPLYFAVSKSNARDHKIDISIRKEISESSKNNKRGSELLDSFGSNKPTSATTIINSEGGLDTPPRTKVFTVRPITSWIDKLANDHGSPTGQQLSQGGAPAHTYQKRELVLKTMQDSYTEIILPFSTDKALLEEYINFGGAVRHGKILEDLDALAGAISYKHTDDGKTDSSPLTIVTASVDRIDFLKPLSVRDLRLSGHVTFVGY
ncbi:hypothetical protein BGZ94_000712, partial [Podila epigama]